MQKCASQKGYSLFEMVVVIAIMGTLSFVTYGVIAINANTFNMVQSNTTLRWDLRKAMQLIQRDVQMMDRQTIQSMNGAGHKSNQIRFSTIDGTAVRYQRQGSGNLRRKIGSAGWLNLTDNVAQKPFRYLDVNSAPTGNKNNVAFVLVNLSRTVGGQTFTLTEQFYVRN